MLHEFCNHTSCHWAPKWKVKSIYTSTLLALNHLPLLQPPCPRFFPRIWPKELSLGTRLVFLLLFCHILHISCTLFNSPLLSFAHHLDTSLPGCLSKLSRCKGVDSCLSHSHHGRWHGGMWGSTEVPSRVGHQRPGRVDGAASGGKN